MRGCREHRWPPGTVSPVQRRVDRLRGEIRDRSVRGATPVNAMTMTRVELEEGLRAWGIAPGEATRLARELRRWAVRKTVEDDQPRDLFGDDDHACGGDL